MIAPTFQGFARVGLKRLALGVAVVVALSSHLMACEKKDDRLVVRRLLVDVDPDAKTGSGPIEREDVRKQVQSLLAAEPQVWLKEGSKVGSTLRVRISAASPGQMGHSPSARRRSAGTQSGVLSLEIEVSGEKNKTGAARPSHRGQSVSDTNGAMPPAPLIEHAFKSALAQALLSRKAQDLDDAVLMSWLEPTAKVTSDQRRQAARILGARRSTAAVPALTRALSGPDRMLAVHALGALSSIEPKPEQRPAAVAAIIDFAEAKSTIVRKQAIQAVSRMDTPLGRAWLWTMSSGHPDSDVQARARLALEEMDPSFAGGAPRVAEQRDPKAENVRRP